MYWHFFSFITCRSNYTQRNKQVTSEIKQIIPIEKISLVPDKDTILLIDGASYKLQAQVKPHNATNKQLRRH